MAPIMGVYDSQGGSFGQGSSYLSTTTPEPHVVAFMSSLSMIIVNELGDKTFIIAAMQAARYPRLLVFFGAASSLGFMHFLSCVLGSVFTVIPRQAVQYAASALFGLIGLQQLREAWNMDASVSLQDEMQDPNVISEQKAESGFVTRTIERFRSYFPPAFIETFALTFVAEWGDRSQISTLVLAAQSNQFVSVFLGGFLAHCLCSLLAVFAGRHAAKYISMRILMTMGGVLFIIFGVIALVTEVDGDL